MLTMPDLTARQQAIYDFVRERIAADGLPPTWAEIARAFGFRQTRAAQKHLQALQAKGYLTLLPGKARGIRLGEKGLPAPPILTPTLPRAAWGRYVNCVHWDDPGCGGFRHSAGSSRRRSKRCW